MPRRSNAMRAADAKRVRDLAARESEWLASVLELYPSCSACGQTITATDATERDGNRNRLRHSKECGVIA